MTDLPEQKAVFVDVDGVLNHAGCDWQHVTDGLGPLDPQCVGRLQMIAARTEAVIVLSSVWRLSEDGKRALAAAGVPTTFTTPNLPDGLTERRREVQAWLREHPAVTRWAVLDDDDDADLGDGSFFLTSFVEGGLTEPIAYRVMEYLR